MVTMSRGIYVGKYEVTRGEWQRGMGSNPSGGKKPLNPVVMVSWNDIQEFLRKLCRLEGVAEGTYRLLTEAEWEYACRGNGDGDLFWR